MKGVKFEYFTLCIAFRKVVSFIYQRINSSDWVPLSGDYLTYERKYEESGKGNPICRTCLQGNESISHILAQCVAYRHIRERIFEEFSKICLFTKNQINFENIKTDPHTLTQFLLDPTSFNLKTRVHISDPVVPTLFRLSRDYCSAIHEERTRKLHELLGN